MLTHQHISKEWNHPWNETNIYLGVLERKCVNYSGKLLYIRVDVKPNSFKDTYVSIPIISFYLLLRFSSSKRLIVIFTHIILHKTFSKPLHTHLLDSLELNDVLIIDILSDKEVK